MVFIPLYKSFVKNCVTAEQLNKAIEEISASIAKKNSSVVTLLTGMLRSMVFIPELYQGGIESAEYDYLYYLPKVASKPGSFTQPANIITDGNVWGYDNWKDQLVKDKDGNDVLNHQYVNNPRELHYFLNPSSTQVKFNQLNTLSRIYETRASEASMDDPEITLVENGFTGKT